MSNENDGWGTVEVSENSGEDTQVAFEIEEEENQPIVVEEEFVEEQKVEAEEPKELKHLSVDADTSISVLTEEALRDLLKKYEKKAK